MIRYLQLLAVCTLAWLLPAQLDAAPEPETVPPFFKMGHRYYIRVALPKAGDERPSLIEAVEFGPRQWIRVRALAQPDPRLASDPRVQKPEPGSILREFWLNLALVGSVSPVDEQEALVPAAEENQSKNVPSFPRVGTAYYFGEAQVSTPYFAKVLETHPSGWFRVQELPFRGNPLSPGPKQWWINGSMVGSLQEAEP